MTDDDRRSESYRYLNNLRPGEQIVVDGKLYMRCSSCRKIIHADRFLFGSLHYCDDE